MIMKPSYPLSLYFTYGEAVASQTAARMGIDNEPRDKRILDNILATASRMDNVRSLLGVPVIVTSWYRCPELNLAIGSKPTSQHSQGVAVDFVAPRYGTPREIVTRVRDEHVLYDQVILEYPDSPSGGWVHISFTATPRLQALVIDRAGTVAFA